jgi:uncharacterized protein (UPF0335 family)
MPRSTPTTPLAGHNSIDKAKLKEIVSRIEAIEQERAELAADVKDLLSEAKSQGFDTKAIRAVLRLRKQDQTARDERQRVVDEYMHSLQGLADLPLGQAAIARASAQLMPPV